MVPAGDKLQGITSENLMAFGVARNSRCVIALVVASLALGALTERVSALSIELKDVAADRVERQRAAAAGALPLPGTPNVADFSDRLKEQGVSLSSPILIRVFKSESELEVWKEKDGAFVLFANYPICHWSGSVGPKIRDGDKQAPEGFYTVTRAQTRHLGRWPKSLNIGFPNVLDQELEHTGSSILIHGGCSSVGCFAMTNPVMDEIHNLTTAAIDGGQDFVPVHVYPFRLTDENMKSHAESPWYAFWANMKEGYDLFEHSRIPPRINVCGGHYGFEQVERGNASGALKNCTSTVSGIEDQNRWLRNVPEPGANPASDDDVPFVRPRMTFPLANATEGPQG